MTQTLDTPTVIPTGNDGKSLQADYLVRVNPDGSKEVASVSASHWGTPSKVFVAHLHRVTIEAPRDGSFFTARTYKNIMTGGVTLKKVPAARYNAKALRAFMADVLASVPALLELGESEQVNRIFDPTWDDA